jgi:hypothetical protein
VLPTFLIIGANRAGTSSLYQYLKQHPEIFMSPVKEPRFFTAQVARAWTADHPDEPAPWRHEPIDDLLAYEGLFEAATSEQERGEASTNYLHDPEAPRLIKEAIPNVKLVAILRDPSERAFSAFRMKVQNGLEPVTDFEQALAAERAGGTWRTYLGLGFYAAQVERYLDLFAAEQIKIHLFEDFRASPGDVLKNILRFLEVDDSFVPDLSVRYNAAGRPYESAVTDSHTEAVMEPNTRKELTELYRRDVVQLQDLIQRDLSGWLV